MQIKLIFIWMVVHQASLWWRGLGELRNGLLVTHLLPHPTGGYKVYNQNQDFSSGFPWASG